MVLDANNYVDINSRLIVGGIANFHNGSPKGIAFMQAGSLKKGGTNANYGGSFYTAGNIGGSEPMQIDQTCFFSNIFLNFII